MKTSSVIGFAVVQGILAAGIVSVFSIDSRFSRFTKHDSDGKNGVTRGAAIDVGTSVFAGWDATGACSNW
jgi:hypothetical protein